MKKLTLALLASAVLVSLNLGAQKAQTFTGEVMDSQCALLGGHQLMAKKGENAKDCSMRCVSIGGKYVLFDTAKKEAYQLDDQKKASQFAGAMAKVSGTFDAATKTIHVADIKAGS